jgi:hypothetical protein
MTLPQEISYEMTTNETAPAANNYFSITHETIEQKLIVLNEQIPAKDGVCS